MAYTIAADMAGAQRTWVVIDEAYRTVGPVEQWLEAHRFLWSPNTVRAYATALAQWWTFLEQRDEVGRWAEIGVPEVGSFLSWPWLTCSVFVTDASHLDTLSQQLTENKALIERRTAEFQTRHGRPMPPENDWLAARTAETNALEKLQAAMRATPGRALQGAGSPTAPTPVVIDTTRHRGTQP